jgi:hypothetical protein
MSGASEKDKIIAKMDNQYLTSRYKEPHETMG